MDESHELSKSLHDIPDMFPVSPVAVIDIGSSSLRLAVAQADPDGTLRPFVDLQQPITLGKDVFTTDRIQSETTERCATGLKHFCTVLAESGVPVDPRQLRAVATSAVREARNRQAFQDRMYIATGIEVEAIDSAEVNRFTYLAMQPLLAAPPFGEQTTTLITEVGAGGTEVLALRGEQVSFSDAYKLGSLRMRKLLDDDRTALGRQRELLEVQIARSTDALVRRLASEDNLNMVAMGGDTRFAVTRLHPDWDRHAMVSLNVDDLSAFTETMLNTSLEDLVSTYHLSYPEAETLGPALLTYVRIAQALELDRLYVTSLTMRDGVLAEMVAKSAWTGRFTEQIINSALAVAEKYAVDRAHAVHVALLCRRLFHALRTEHGLPPRCELILTIAALLHEIGRFVSSGSHHKHSMYLIEHSDVFGLGRRDILIASRVARYHRRALPSPTHSEYIGLDRDDRVLVLKLAAILRVADGLDRGHTQKARDLDITCRRDELVIVVENAPDITLERIALEEKSDLFQYVYGMTVRLRQSLHGES